MTVPATTAEGRIARAAGTVMVAIVIGQITGLARQILVASAFGTGLEMEAFSAANRVSETIFTLVAGGALASAFIPTFTGLLAHEKRSEAWRLASAVANLALLILASLALLAALLARPIVHFALAPGFAGDPAKEALTVSLLRVMLPSAVIFGLSGLVMGILNSHQVFFIPALTPSLYQLGLIFGVTILKPALGIYGLAWGVVLGSALHLLLQVPALWKLRGRYTPVLGLEMPGVREVFRLLGPRLLGVAVVQLNFWVNTNLASRQPAGSVAAITIGFMLMLVPQAAIAQAVATAAMPTLAAQYARGSLEAFRAALGSALRGVLLLSLPASLGLMLLRYPLVTLLYQRGAFTAQSTDLVTWALLWYAAGLVGHCGVEVLARAFYAMHDTRTPVLIGAVAMSLNVIFSFAFSALFWRLGWAPHGGLALANSLATALEMAGLWAWMHRRLGSLQSQEMIPVLLRGGLAAALMAAGLVAWLRLDPGWPAWLAAGGGVLLGGALYGLGSLALGVPEARSLIGWLTRWLA